MVVLALTMVVGGAGYLALRHMTGGMKRYREVQIAQYHFYQAKEQTDQWLLNNYQEGRSAQEAARLAAHAALEKASDVLDGVRGETADKAAGAQLGRLGEAIGGYREAFNRYVDAEAAKMELEKEIVTLHLALAAVVEETPLWNQDMAVALELLLGATSVYFNRNDDFRWRETEAGVTEMAEAIREWRERVENSDALRPIGETIQERFAALEARIREYHSQVANQRQVLADMNQQKEAVNTFFSELRDRTVENLSAVEVASNRVILSVLAAALVFGIFFGFSLTRKIVGSIGGVIDRIDSASDRLGASTDQIAAAGETQSEGASEQASSLEEVASSLEEISAMIRQNAENSEQANRHMAEANQVVARANSTMSELTQSMTDVSRASEETATIIKTIDEIAFQTNLLALNAAVEAARAGEAGAGFAVVAGEVKNLAARAGEAAKNTAERIESTVRMVQEGAGLVTRTNQAFSEVTVSASKVGELVRELAEASEEQANGIDQISRATSEMDQVVQRNAAHAEESASISEDLRYQVRSMQEAVTDLVGLIGRRQDGGPDRLPDTAPEDPFSEPAPAEKKRAPRTPSDSRAIPGRERPSADQLTYEKELFDDF